MLSFRLTVQSMPLTFNLVVLKTQKNYFFHGKGVKNMLLTPLKFSREIMSLNIRLVEYPVDFFMKLPQSIAYNLSIFVNAFLESKLYEDKQIRKACIIYIPAGFIIAISNRFRSRNYRYRFSLYGYSG